jgi:CTP synthase
VLIPGGFGIRGIEGKVLACEYARKNNIPYLGICLGMQIAVIEFARNVCGITDATSEEFDHNSKNKVIDFMPDQNGEIPKGGTMRLGSYPCKIKKGSLLEVVYKRTEITERHRHRYEFVNKYTDIFAENGLFVSGTSPDENIVETVEIPGNRFFVGVQFHPEYKSRPNRAHPLFVGFVKAALENAERSGKK